MLDIKIDQFKYYNSKGYFDSSNDYLDVTRMNTLTFSSNFTLYNNTLNDQNIYPLANMRIGALPGGASAFYGYIQDLRITKDLARYTTNFTPPEKFV